MDNEFCTLALKSTLQEVQNICPDIKNSFIFNERGKIIAADGHTSEEIIAHVADLLDSIMDKADTLGGFDNVALETSRGGIDVSHTGNLSIVTVTSKTADKKYVAIVNHVLIPTIIRLLEKITPGPFENNVSDTKQEHETFTAVDHSTEEHAEEQATELEPSLEADDRSDYKSSEPPAHQLMVDKMDGLFARPDTVRIDEEILSQWQELYEGVRIDEVGIETDNGKTVRCKIKPLKDSKHERTGIIQMHEKVLRALEIAKGDLVRVKPIID